MHDYEYCNQGNHSISCDNLVMHLGLKIICILMKFGESCSVSVLNFSAMFENAALSTMCLKSTVLSLTLYECQKHTQCQI